LRLESDIKKRIRFKEKPKRKPFNCIPPKKLPRKNFLDPISIEIISWYETMDKLKKKKFIKLDILNS
tara:strand:+ start:536 stop:736 length:201 start_codon:yes stop_codon:yes gene_type:complete